MLQKSPERPPISQRELEIARAYTGGKTYRQIADDLGIAPATVRTHINNIYRKLEVSSKIELLHKLSPTADATPTDRPLNWRIPLVIAAALLLMIGAFAYRPVSVASVPANPVRSLAMVLFAHDGKLAERDALVRDLVDGLSNRVELFMVMPTNLRLTLPPDVYANRLGRGLNQRYILTGQVTTRGDELAVTAQLFDRMKGAIIWRENVESEEQSIYTLRLDLLESLERAVDLPKPAEHPPRCLEIHENERNLFDEGVPVATYELNSQLNSYCPIEETGPR